MSTRAIKYLKQKDIPFKVIKYEQEDKGAEFAAKATGFPVEKTIKTLVVELGREKYSFAPMPGDKYLDLKSLAKACSEKRVSMADIATAQRLTGYQVGGISPFGSKQRLPVVMEESLLQFDNVIINAGQRGIMLMMAPEDIVKALDCTLYSFARK